MTATDDAVALARLTAQAAADKLGSDIVLIDVSERLVITDVFVIVTGTSERQVEAIVDEVERKAREGGYKPVRREGQRDGRWVLIDYGEVVVHVQHAEERAFYALERLWRDCEFVPFTDAGASVSSDAGASVSSDAGASVSSDAGASVSSDAVRP